MTTKKILELLKKRSAILRRNLYSEEVDNIRDIIFRALKKNFDEYEFEFIFETLTKFGWAPNLVYDDNGHFAVSGEGFNPISTEKFTERESIMTIVEPDHWKSNVRTALRYYLLKSTKHIK